MKNYKGNIILSIGIILVSISIILNNHINSIICDCITGVGLGLEILGLFMPCKKK